eukprot:s2690_g13.t1
MNQLLPGVLPFFCNKWLSIFSVTSPDLAQAGADKIAQVTPDVLGRHCSIGHGWIDGGCFQGWLRRRRWLRWHLHALRAVHDPRLLLRLLCLCLGGATRVRFDPLGDPRPLPQLEVGRVSAASARR